MKIDPKLIPSSWEDDDTIKKYTKNTRKGKPKAHNMIIRCAEGGDNNCNRCKFAEKRCDKLTVQYRRYGRLFDD